MAAPSYFDNQSGGYAPTSTAPASSSGGWAAVLASLQPAPAKPVAAAPALSMPVIVAGVCAVALVAYLVLR